MLWAGAEKCTENIQNLDTEHEKVFELSNWPVLMLLSDISVCLV